MSSRCIRRWPRRVAGGASGLSPRTIGHVHTLLKGALRWAVRLDVAGRNVCDAVTPPKVVRKEAIALSVEQAQELLTATAGTRWGPLFTIALATGARRGELSALRWNAVDLDARTMIVRASVTQFTASIAEKTTKTGRVRSVALGDMAVAAFRSQKARQAEERLRAGPRYQDDGYVFTNPLGRRVSPSAITRGFYDNAQTLELPTTSFHSLRHTAASWLLASGVDVRTVGGVLGHSTAATTLSIYAHLVAGVQAAAVARIDERLAAAAKKG